jgi:hypothetical protein
MGWERRSANEYYYRKERDGSRVKSIYVGRGEIAHMVSDLQSTSGLFERALSIAYPAQTEQPKDQDAKVEHACRLIDSITQASLLAAGFHMHRRQWRKKRYGHNAKESRDEGGRNSEDQSKV